MRWPFEGRCARAGVDARRGAGWVGGARLAGSGRRRVGLFVMLPSILPVMMVQVSLNLGWAILNAAGLSFLGLGVQPPTPEWGTMLADSREFISRAPWLVTFLGIAILVTVLAINLVGDGLRDTLDPKPQRR